MGFINCDSHVLETEATWEYLDPSERIYKPVTAYLKEDDHPRRDDLGTPAKQMWLIQDEWVPRFPSDGNVHGYGNVFEPASTQLFDPATRVEDLDALGIDVQLIFSTCFLSAEVDHPVAEAALKRSYNRWVADGVDGAGGRLAWAIQVPTRTMDRAIQELEYGKNHGAAGVHMQGIPHGLYLTDPYFWPLYERAQDLDLAILIHIGLPLRRLPDVPIGASMPTPAVFQGHLWGVMSAFHAIVASDFNVRFPRLRWGIIEAGATWVPAVLQAHSRLLASRSPGLRWSPLESRLTESKNLFIACESDEDIGYLSRMIGENCLVTGTDYAHNDMGSEILVHSAISSRNDLHSRITHKIVDDNGRRLLGIDSTFRPSDNARGTRPRPAHVRSLAVG